MAISLLKMMEDLSNGVPVINHDKEFVAGEFDFTGVQSFVVETDEESFDAQGAADKVTKEGFVLASPFPKFSIEIDRGGIEMADDDDNPTIEGIMYSCFYCEEVGVGVYDIVVQMVDISDIENGNAYFFYYSLNSRDGGKLYRYAMSIINNLIERMTNRKHGLVNYRGKVFFKNKHGRKVEYKPRDVIYIHPKRAVLPSVTATGNKIRWQSSWLVRSHWRKLINTETLGLSRVGDRIVKGFTWISNYKKGDEKPVKAKVRKVMRGKKIK
jgi:hypothetical protein